MRRPMVSMAAAAARGLTIRPGHLPIEVEADRTGTLVRGFFAGIHSTAWPMFFLFFVSGRLVFVDL